MSHRQMISMEHVWLARLNPLGKKFSLVWNGAILTDKKAKLVLF